MQKIYPNAEAALEGLLFDGMFIAAGGFGLCGIPERLIDPSRRRREGPHRRVEHAGIGNEASASSCAPQVRR